MKPVEQQFHDLQNKLDGTEKFLLLTDTLLVGLKDDVFGNCEIIRAEFHFMPG